MEENKPLAPLRPSASVARRAGLSRRKAKTRFVEATAWARERGLALFVLGGGSNLLVADADSMGWCCGWGCRGLKRMRMDHPAICSANGSIGLQRAKTGTGLLSAQCGITARG